MNHVVRIAVCTLCLCLAACGTKFTATPFEGELPLTYGQASGKLSIISEVGDFQFSLPTVEILLDYDVQPQGESLLWKIEVDGKFLGVKDGKAVKPVAANEVLSLYPLVNSHDRLAFTIRTDRLGNGAVVEAYTNATTGQKLDDDRWKKHYLAVFSSVFPPFSVPSAAVNTVVSQVNIVLAPEWAVKFPPAQVKVTGTKLKNFKKSIALQYENTSNEYKNYARQKCQDSLSVYSLLDEETRIVFQARSVLRNKNGIYFTRIKKLD